MLALQHIGHKCCLPSTVSLLIRLRCIGTQRLTDLETLKVQPPRGNITNDTNVKAVPQRQ
jgi:hypothetical protein